MGDFYSSLHPPTAYSFPPPSKMSVADENTPTASQPETQGEASQKQQELNARRVYVGNLSFKTNSTALKEAFAQYGDIENAHVVSIGQKRRGFGFVTFAKPEDATKAVQGANGTDLAGRAIRTELSTSTTTPQKKKKAAKKAPAASSDAESSKPAAVKGAAKAAPAKKQTRRVRVPASEREVSQDVVYLGGLAAELTKEQLNEFLAPYGVQSVTIRKAYRPRGTPRPRFAFVRVDTEENCDKMVNELEGKEYEGETLSAKKAFARLPPVKVEKEAPKENVQEEKEKPKATKKSLVESLVLASPRRRTPRRVKNPPR